MSEIPRLLTAVAEVSLASPGHVMRGLCARFSEFGAVTGRGRCRRIETGFGTADVEDCGKCLRICAAGKDEVALAYVKLAMAEHLLSITGDDAPSIVWRGDGMAGSLLPYFREMRVAYVANVTPRMRRLTLTGDNLHRFESDGLHVRLLFPKAGIGAQRWPVMGEDGRPILPPGEGRPDVRIYTLRRVDPAAGEVDIDFVIHKGNYPGTRFAIDAKVGDIVGMTGPGGGPIPEANWCLLLGDETALPAIARMIEQLPPQTQIVARIEVVSEDEVQNLRHPGLDLQWLVRGANSESSLQSALARIDWPADDRSVFAWAGCEYRDFQAIRSHFRNERKLTREQHLAVAYWRRGHVGDDA